MKEKIEYRFSPITKIIIAFACLLILMEVWQVYVRYITNNTYLFQLLSIISLLLLIGTFILRSRIKKVSKEFENTDEGLNKLLK